MFFWLLPLLASLQCSTHATFGIDQGNDDVANGQHDADEPTGQHDADESLSHVLGMDG